MLERLIVSSILGTYKCVYGVPSMYLIRVYIMYLVCMFMMCQGVLYFCNVLRQ